MPSCNDHALLYPHKDAQRRSLCKLLTQIYPHNFWIKKIEANKKLLKLFTKEKQTPWNTSKKNSKIIQRTIKGVSFVSRAWSEIYKWNIEMLGVVIWICGTAHIYRPRKHIEVRSSPEEEDYKKTLLLLTTDRNNPCLNAWPNLDLPHPPSLFCKKILQLWQKTPKMRANACPLLRFFSGQRNSPHAKNGQLDKAAISKNGNSVNSAKNIGLLMSFGHTKKISDFFAKTPRQWISFTE